MTKRKSRASLPDSKRAKVEELDDSIYSTIFKQISDLQDEKRSITKLFLRLPSKKVYPDYYDLITSPISLHEIKEKIVKKEYESLDQFQADFTLMYENAATYNDRESIVALDAKRIEEFVREQVVEWKINNYVSDDLKQAMHAFVDDLINFSYKRDNDKVHPSDWFMVEPDRDEYPDYYEVIEQPIALNTIKERIDAGELASPEEFLTLVGLVFANSKQYNAEGTLVYLDTEALEQHFESKREGFTKKASAIKQKDADRIKKESEQPEESVGDEEQDTELKHEGTETGTPRRTDDERDAEDREREEGEEGEDMDRDEEDEEEEEEYEEVVYPSKNVRRPAGQTADNVLLRELSLSSIIPQFRNQYQKTSTNQMPATFYDLFQYVFPASPKRSVRSFTLQVPAHHSTINLNAILHESLNMRQHVINVTLNKERRTPVSSTVTNPWAENTKPIQNRYELRLAPQKVNQLEVVVQAASNERSELGDTETVTLWIVVQ